MPIDWLTLGAASLSGLLGGAHCAAMCGGIATGFSVTAQRSGVATARRSIAPALEANLARIGGYVIAGAIAGGLGHGIVGVARMDGLATALRMLVGLVLIVVALRLFDRRGRLSALGGAGARMWAWLRPLQQRMLPADSRAKRIGLAVLWGWLPCGLVYSTLLWSASQGNALDSALLMLAFGLGTWPVLLATGLAAERVTALLRKRSVRMAGGLLVILFGIWTLPGPHQHWLMGH